MKSRIDFRDLIESLKQLKERKNELERFSMICPKCNKSYMMEMPNICMEHLRECYPDNFK
jgi:hypothetical protein